MGAPTIDEITVADDPERWAALGFTVRDGLCDIGGVRVSFAPRDTGRGVLGWSLRDPLGTDLDGLATRLSMVPERDAAPVHPNGVVSIDHVVAMTPSFARSVRALERAGWTCAGCATSRPPPALRYRPFFGSVPRSSSSCRSPRRSWR